MASCAASARPPTRNTAASSRRTTRWRGASRRSTSSSPRSRRPSRSCVGLKPRFEEHHGITYADDALRAAAELAGAPHQRAAPARQGDRRGRRGRRAAAPEADRRARAARWRCAHIEDVVARMARIPAKSVSTSDREVLKNLERNLKLVIFGQDKAIEALAAAIKMARSGLGESAQAGRQLPVRRSDRRRQDRGHAAAGDRHGRRVPALRHVRVHGAAHGLAPDRRAAGLRRLRPGRPAHRGDHQAPALRAAAR